MWLPLVVKRSEPYVRYTMDEENNSAPLRSVTHETSVSTSNGGQRLSVPHTINTSTMPRQTARKTTRPNSSNIASRNNHQRNTASSSAGGPSGGSSNNYQNLVPQVKHLNNSTIYVDDENKPKGKVIICGVWCRLLRDIF